MFFFPTPTRAFSFNIRAWLTLNSCNDSFTHTASVLFVNYSAPGINSEALSLWVYCGVMLVLSVSLLNTPNADKTGVQAAPLRALNIALLNDSCSPLSALMQLTEWAVYKYRIALQTTIMLWSHVSPVESGLSHDFKHPANIFLKDKIIIKCAIRTKTMAILLHYSFCWYISSRPAWPGSPRRFICVVQTHKCHLEFQPIASHPSIHPSSTLFHSSPHVSLNNSHESRAGERDTPIGLTHMGFTLLSLS